MEKKNEITIERQLKIDLLTKLHNIMSEIGVIEKDATNDFHHYQYASEFAIKVKIQPLLIKHKVLFYLETVSLQRTEVVGDRSKTQLTDVVFRYHFVDTETGQELTGQFVGTGDDKSDKGTYKAITGAIKYILTSTFLVPTGDDPETAQQPEKEKVRQVVKSTTQAAPASNKCPNCGATGNYHSPKCPSYQKKEVA